MQQTRFLEFWRDAQGGTGFAGRTGLNGLRPQPDAGAAAYCVADCLDNVP